MFYNNNSRTLFSNNNNSYNSNLYSLSRKVSLKRRKLCTRAMCPKITLIGIFAAWGIMES